MDVLTPQQRRYNMSRIRGRDTRPELLLRGALHANGLRFRLHVGDLPGRPDLVFPRHRAVILANGCFWHGHDCPMFKMPKTNTEFWQAKIDLNRQRDVRNVAALISAGWRTLIIWECALKGRLRRPFGDLIDDAASFIRGSATTREIGGLPS